MSEYLYNLGKYFLATVKKHFDRPAIVLPDGKSILYSELEGLSNQYANFMLSQGVMQGNVVAIIHNKSVNGYAIMIACLKIGAIYTNLDGQSPLERLSRMLQTCSPSMVFSPENSVNLFDNIVTTAIIMKYNTSNFSKKLNMHSEVLNYDVSTISGNTPAYIMFTSGSTGFPKGVVISHANVINFIQWTKSTYNTTSKDRFTNINPMHFDNSVFDFYASLFSGASLIPINEAETRNPRKMVKALNTLKPTIWFSVPSMLVYCITLRAFTANDLPYLRIFTFGGEGFPKNQLRKLWNLFGNRITFINVYGPTECTCICSSYTVSESDMEEDNLLPLGNLAPNFSHIVISNYGTQVSDGETGELYIAGSNVGMGYYNNREQTNKSFIQNPMHNKFTDVVYKSGDLVRIDADSKFLHFCGRIDNQVKRMGYRIELEEIENALGSLPYVLENGVIFQITESSGKIIACVHTKQDEETIFQDLKEKIPSYMLPDEVIVCGDLPKNRNGKIDRMKLKELYLQDIGSD